MQANVVEIKCSNTRWQMIGTWVILLAWAAVPWALLILKKDNTLLFFIVNHASVLLFVLFTKINSGVIIDVKNQEIIHEWKTLLGIANQTSIKLKDAQILLDDINYRGNDLLRLRVIERKPGGQKIKVTKSVGFNRRQISAMYRSAILSVSHIS